VPIPVVDHEAEANKFLEESKMVDKMNEEG